MNAQTICDRILSDAREDAARTLGEAQQKSRALEAENDRRIEDERLRILRRAETEAEEERSNMLRMAQLDEKKLDLAMKRQVLDETFETAVRGMSLLPDDRARDYLEGLLLEAAEGECRILVRESDAHLYDEAFLRRVNGKLKNAHVTLSDQRRHIPGGFILEKDGVEINCAYDAVVSQLRDRLEADAAQALFE